MIFVTSDLHFFHDKEFIYKPRGFNSVYEMNETIIKNWNEVVNWDDEVYVLGDICLGGGSDEALERNRRFIERLNGRLHIVLGNHDSSARIDMYRTCCSVVEVCGLATLLKAEGYTFYLSHYPTITSNYDIEKPLKKRVINLCGHTHTNNKFTDMTKGLIYHVELDAHNNRPIAIEEIIKDIRGYIHD